MKKRFYLISILVIVVIFTVGCQKSTPISGSDDNSEPIAETPNTMHPVDETVNETNDETTYDKVSEYMKEESENAFSPYYELLEFKISNFKEEVVDGNIEVTFFYTIIHKNYDKDPDTVDYIKEAKESGSINYQQMYDEYLQPKEMNFDLKVVIDENNVITLYSNISPVGIEWEETKMTDYILSN